nr:hypothetical protein [Tanacetum cinerariifolium]
IGWTHFEYALSMVSVPIESVVIVSIGCGNAITPSHQHNKENNFEPHFTLLPNIRT